MSDDREKPKPHESEFPEPPEVPHRRVFLAITAAGTCAIGAAVAIPAAMMVADPLKGSAASEKKFHVANLEDLEPGVAKRVPVVGDEVDAWNRAKDRRLGAVWLIRTGAREVRALSTSCPHLGCGIDVSADGKGFACPCHTSDFDAAGKLASGPSPRGMDALPVEIGPKGQVLVTWKRFRIGEKQQVELA